MSEDTDSNTTDLARPTDRQLLDAVGGLLRVLQPDQEARLSKDQLARLLILARRGSNG